MEVTGVPEMYEFVQNSKTRRKGKRRRDWKIGVMIAVAVIILAVIGGLLWWKLTAGQRFSKFCGKLSESTTYAYEHNAAAVEDADGTYRLTTENLYELYQCVCVYGPGKESCSAPEGDGLTVTYGNGAELKLVKAGEGKDTC